MTALVAIVALAISLYGAVLATLVWRDSRGRDRRRLVVRCYFGYEKDRDGGTEAVQVIFIQAVNDGPRPVEVSGAGFIVGEDREQIERSPYTVHPSSTPWLLADGASIQFSYRTQDEVSAAHQAEVIQVFVRSSHDEFWFGEPDDWLRPLMISRRWW
jgi:hypothetical protein